MKSLYIFLFLSTLTFHMDTTCMLLQAARVHRTARVHQNMLTQQQRIKQQRIPRRLYNAGHPLDDPFVLQQQIDALKQQTNLLKRHIEMLENNTKEDSRLLQKQIDTLRYGFVTSQKDRTTLLNQYEASGPIHNEHTQSFLPEYNMHYRSPAKE